MVIPLGNSNKNHLQIFGFSKTKVYFGGEDLPMNSPTASHAHWPWPAMIPTLNLTAEVNWRIWLDDWQEFVGSLKIGISPVQDMLKFWNQLIFWYDERDIVWFFPSLIYLDLVHGISRLLPNKGDEHIRIYWQISFVEMYPFHGSTSGGENLKVLIGDVFFFQAPFFERFFLDLDMDFFFRHSINAFAVFFLGWI